MEAEPRMVKDELSNPSEQAQEKLLNTTTAQEGVIRQIVHVTAELTMNNAAAQCDEVTSGPLVLLEEVEDMRADLQTKCEEIKWLEKMHRALLAQLDEVRASYRSLREKRKPRPEVVYKNAKVQTRAFTPTYIPASRGQVPELRPSGLPSGSRDLPSRVSPRESADWRACVVLSALALVAGALIHRYALVMDCYEDIPRMP
jgi:hypothetical protein